MKKRYLPLIFMITVFLTGGRNSYSQVIKSFSLQEAINYAKENNFSIKSARLDFIIQKKKVKEFLATGYPQISSGIKYTNFINVPTTLFPDFLTPAIVGVNENLFGLNPVKPVPEAGSIPVKFGTNHNMTFDLSASQLIFNGSFLVGLMANKKLQKLSEETIAKTEIDVKDAVTRAYFMVLVAEENKNIVDSTLVSIRKIYNDTKEYYKNGFVENTDVEQFELLLSNLETTKKTVDKKTELAYKVLKLQMGFPFTDPIILSDKLEFLYSDALKMQIQNYDLSKNIDFRLLETQRDLSILNLKNEKSKYLPMINGFFDYQQNGMSNTFDFFKFSNDWFPTTLVGLQISIPIFNSGIKMYRLQQAKYGIDKINLAMEQVKQSLLVQEESAKTDFQIAMLNFGNKQKSLNIAKSIYMKTAIKYKEGISSSIDLSQTYNQYLGTQTDYINAALQLLNAKQALDKIYTISN
jgi:outer membrane protein